MSKKVCVVCDGNGKWPRDVGPPCDACNGTGITIDDGALDADRAPQPPTDVDDDAAREWLARWDAFAIAALPACITCECDGGLMSGASLERSAKQAASIADHMMQIQPGDTE